MPLINEKASTAPCENPNSCVQDRRIYGTIGQPTALNIPGTSEDPIALGPTAEEIMYGKKYPTIEDYINAGVTPIDGVTPINITSIPPVERYEDLLRQAFGAKENYRQTKAELFLKLSAPTDGSKKPSNDTIMSMIDTDVELAAMRAIRASTEIDLKVFELQHGIIGTVHA